jgi:hypothetical protein
LEEFRDTPDCRDFTSNLPLCFTSPTAPSPAPLFFTNLFQPLITAQTTSIMARAKAALTESKSKANSKASADTEMPKAKATKKGTRGDGGKKKKGRSSPILSTLKCFTDLLIDPNAPKRGLSAYMFFANAQRDNVREEHPGISFGRPSLALLPLITPDLDN